MSRLQKLNVALLFAITTCASPTLAQTNANYQSFSLAPERLGEVASEDFRRCIALAGVNTTSKSSCVVVEQRLIDRRLDVRYRTVLEQLSGDNARAFRVGQQSWVRIRDRDCVAASRLLFNDQDMVEYVKQVRKCRLDESLRRIVWLELSSPASG